MTLIATVVRYRPVSEWCAVARAHACAAAEKLAGMPIHIDSSFWFTDPLCGGRAWTVIGDDLRKETERLTGTSPVLEPGYFTTICEHVVEVGD